uniref:Uncharacterized protein n=1 Tax=Anguilla anguilla TaxID=7936 RepID=A0A0E9RAU3_ANGAN
MLYSTYLAIHVATVVSPSLAHINFFLFLHSNVFQVKTLPTVF